MENDNGDGCNGVMDLCNIQGHDYAVSDNASYDCMDDGKRGNEPW